MAEIRIANKVFENDKGELIKYKRVEISGIIAGEKQTFELPKQTPNDMKLLTMIIGSTETEESEVSVRSASAAEQPEVTKNGEEPWFDTSK